MKVLPIYVYDHAILKQKAQKVDNIDDSIVQFIEQMKLTMHEAEGIGLAANQVGSPLAITVIDITPVEGYEHTKPLVLINPEITYYSEEETDYEEGCLSLPNLRELVLRPEAIQVSFYNEKIEPQTMQADGLMARVMQHEIDHLNGIYFTDRLSQLKRTLLQSKLRRISKGETNADYAIVLPDGTVISGEDQP
ncbi:MAG: peptide deformylase [Candidatus Kapaibacteriota bacterium]